MTEPVTVTLSRPLTVIDQERTSLTIREPLADDLAICGLPFRVSGGEAVDINADAVKKLIARLAGIPANAAGKLPAIDYMACLPVIMGFFGAEPPSSG